MDHNVRYPNRLPGPGQPPRLIRQTHTQCGFGPCTFPISEYVHQFCFFCCHPNSIEYIYHFGNQNAGHNFEESESNSEENEFSSEESDEMDLSSEETDN